MVIQKFNVEFNEKNPFDISEEDFDKELTWDWHFERCAYEVKKETIEKFKDVLKLMVENRGIVNYVALVCTIDIPSILRKDFLLIHFFQSLFSRMTKTSKVIQDLSIEGNYIEAKALLRANFERTVLLEYFSKNQDLLKDYLSAKKEKDWKKLKKYSIKKLVEEIKKDYKDYSYLCHFAHPNMYEEDVSTFEIMNETWARMSAYNSLDQDSFLIISYWNNNLLLEAFLCVFEGMKKKLSKKEIKENFKNVFDMTKKLKFIEIKNETLPK